MLYEEEDDKIGETWVEAPTHMVGHIIGKGGQYIKPICELTDTYIEAVKDESDDTISHFIISGKSRNRCLAKLKIKKNLHIARNKSAGFFYSWLLFVDGKEGTYELQPCEFEGFKSKLVLKSPVKDYNGRGNYEFVAQKLTQIMQRNKESNRQSVIWCHFGKILIRQQPDEREYTLTEVESHLLSKKSSAAEASQWHARFFSGIKDSPDHEKLIAFQDWVYSSPMDKSYKRCDITYYTPLCNEIRIKVFMILDKSKNDKNVYRNTKCPKDVHEIHNIIMSSDTSPYFYICESTFRAGLIDLFQPSSHQDFRLIVEANRLSFSEDEEIYQEAKILFDYVKSHLQTTEEGEIILPREYCPPDFDESYNRTSFRETYRIFSSENVNITARLSSSEDPKCIFASNVQHGDLDIHLEIENCHQMTPEQILDKVPQLMVWARDLARVLTIDENVPPEILARGPKARIAYKRALKNGKIKNRRVPVVLVGQARSGKTSLLRSLNGEKFDPLEDSTVGAKLQRSLSKVEDNVWEANQSNENLLFDQSVSKELVKGLSENPRRHQESSDYDYFDSPDDYGEEDRMRNENTVETFDAIHVDHQSEPFDQTEENLQEALKISDDTAAKMMESVRTQDKFKVTLDLPSDIVNRTKSILENSSVENQTENDLFFETMDFAGQPIYSVTHPLFLPPRAVYLLVHNLENALHNKSVPIVKAGSAKRTIDEHNPLTNLDHLKFWLSLIAANSTQDGCSPVFLVSTHADKVLETDAVETSREILKALKKEDFLPGQHLEHGIYTVDNTVSGNAGPQDFSISKLKTNLQEKAMDLPQCKEDIPFRWLHFEKVLDRFRNEGKKEITPEEVSRIAKQCGVDTSTDELETLLNYLHDLKVIIHFPEINTIIINTQWLLDMFAKVITVQPIECHKGHEKEWRRLEEKGIVDTEFLKYLWKDLLNDDTSVESLITIMEKFALVCKQQDGSLLVPAMLLNSDIAESWNDIMKPGSSLPSPLVIRFDSSHLPFGLFPRLVVAVDKICHTELESLETPHLSGNHARFYVSIGGDELDIVFMSDTSTITVALFPDDQNYNDRYSYLCQVVLKFLRKTLEEMRQSFPWMKPLTSEFCIRCSVCSKPCEKHNTVDCHRDSCVHLIPEKKLSKRRPRCDRSSTKLNNVIPTDTYLHWFPRTRLEEGKEEAATNMPGSSVSLTNIVDDSCKELIPYLNAMALCTGEATEKAAKQVAKRLGLDKISVHDPPEEIRQKSRACYKYLVDNEMNDCIKAIKNEFPSGMTGPLQPNILVKDMHSKKKELLSYSMTVNVMEWKAFAKEQVKRPIEEIDFLKHSEKNPALYILDKYCSHWTLDRLYDALVVSGLKTAADNYL